MESKDMNLSLQFYNYLCNIVGSEEVVQARRKIFTAKDISDSHAFGKAISSGSKAEGLDLKGSDFDQMMQLKFIRVYENLNDVQSNPDKIPFVMVTNDTKSGFTKIKLVNKSPLDLIKGWCETVGEDTFISSKRFREQFVSLCHDLVIHGPCQTTIDGQIDHAICLRCAEWISPAQQWIYRSRKSWPQYTLVTSAVKYGVLFVPIGCKNSPNEHLQWRISFSVTEKMLIRSFTHTQLLCYALMKTILKDFIKPRQGDLLCSYFLKTIMFWLSEEKNPSEWKPENMIPCFLDCIRRLIYCVEYKTCLHYFIPENNLFEDRFTDKEHTSLMHTLRFVYNCPWISVFETSTFKNYRLESVYSPGMILAASELSCYCHLYMTHGSSVYSSMKRFVNVSLDEELCSFMISIHARKILLSSHPCNMVARNKSFYQQYKQSLCYFKISLRSASISTWLLLPSLFYNCKRFEECLHIINNCLFSCTPDKIYLNYANSFAEQTLFNQIKQKWGLLHAFKYLMFDNVRFRYPFCLLPEELTSLTDGEACFIPPVVYSYLLQFLCCYQLGNYRGKHNALHNLELTVKKQYLIYPLENTLRTVHRSLEIVRQLL